MFFVFLIALAYFANCAIYPKCSSSGREDVWRMKAYACSITPPKKGEPPKHFKLSFYVKSMRRFFGDRFIYRVIPGPGIKDITAPTKWVSGPPFVNSWFTCNLVNLTHGPPGQELTYPNGYCALSVHVKNKNWVSSSLLGIMFHIDEEDKTYVLPPPEFQEPPKDDIFKIRRPSAGVRAFRIVSTVVLAIVLIAGLFFVVGVFVYRTIWRLFANPRKVRQAKKANRTERERVESVLRKGERIRQRKKELGMAAEDELSEHELDELSSEPSSSEDSDNRKKKPYGLASHQSGTAGPRQRLSALKKKQYGLKEGQYDDDDMAPLLPRTSSSHKSTRRSTRSATSQPAPYTSSLDTDQVGPTPSHYTEAERRLEMAIKKAQEEEEARKRLLWQSKPGTRNTIRKLD